VEENVMSMNQE